MIALLLACATPAPDAATVVDVACDDVTNTRATVVTSMTFAPRDGNVSPGFDLDHHVTDANDEEGCFQPDLVDPSGVEGIDNAFSAFFPILEATEGAAIEGLLEEAIESGELLFLFQLEDVDDPLNDPCVNLVVYQGIGTPRLGTNGMLLSGQTYDIDPDIAPSRVEGLALVDGRIEARGFDITLPLQFFDVFFTVTIHEAAVALTLDPLGDATGYLGGGLEIQPMIELLELRTDIAIGPLAIDMLRAYADLYPDEAGTCHQLSVVLELKGTSAFLFEE